MPEHARDPNELGALWIKSGSKGDYMTGTINGQPVVVFRNDRKPPGSKAPDWRVLKPTPRAKPTEHVRNEAVGTNEPVWGREHQAPVDDSDIPF